MSVDLSTGPGKMMKIDDFFSKHFPFLCFHQFPFNCYVFAVRPGRLRLWPRPGCWCVQLAGPHRAIEESWCLRKIFGVARRYVALTDSVSCQKLWNMTY